MDNKQEQFNGEQVETLKRINTILDSYLDKLYEGSIETDEYIENHDKVVHLGKRLKEKGFEMESFILWHRLIGSTIGDPEHFVGSFDTPDRDIEKFILETFAKYGKI